MMTSSKPMMPLAVKSNESLPSQLASAKAEGDAVAKALDWLKQQTPATSGELRAGEYKIVYALSAPEGWYEYSNNNVKWRAAENANAHLWLFILDGADGRVVPPLQIRASLMDQSKHEIAKKAMPFAWIPLINGYGNNFDIPAGKASSLVIKIAAPLYRRHDPYNGDRFTNATVAIIPLLSNDYTGLPLLSDAMEKNQQLAKNAGDAYSNTLKIMYSQANDGRDTLTGDYFLAYAIEYSEGYWYSKASKFVYENKNEQSAKHNSHIEVVARDRQTGRFLHDLNVVATVKQPNGDSIGTHQEMFMWHPWLYHYGENWRVPNAGDYELHIHIDPPPYHRYGKNLGNQFTQPIDMDFKNIMIKTGQK